MRRIGIIAVGTHQPSWAVEAEEYYLRQLRQFQVGVVAIKNGATKDKEARAVLTKLPEGGQCVLLERRGEMMDEEKFAQAMNGWIADGRGLHFVIGGADGAGEALLERADKLLSLSGLVFPHGLARLILIEQLFRLDCRLRRHPYPR